MINANTDLYCIFGNPVRHSKSPAIHNACFQRHGINSIYLAFEIDDISKGISAMKTLDIKGASVTIPFKQEIMAHLDHIDEDALNMGAVNTVVNQGGKLSGYNTDCQAAIAPLKSYGIRDKKVLILGAGGAAQAIAYGIHQEKGHTVIVNRTEERGKRLASKYNSDFIRMNDTAGLQTIQADIIINTTPVGMSPHVDGVPFPSFLLDSQMMVMDIVYNPLKTRFLLEAETKGCRTIDGLSMFLHQGAAQFRLWTGIRPDTTLMRRTILNGDN